MRAFAALAALMISTTAHAAPRSFVRAEGAAYDGRSTPDKRQGTIEVQAMPSQSGRVAASASWLNANGHDEQKLMGGYIFDLGGNHSLRFSVAAAINALQFPSVSGELELAAPLSRPLVLTFTSRVSNYEKARVVNALLGTGLDWYASGSSVFIGRIYYSYDSFGTVGTDYSAVNFMVKYFHLFETVDARAWLYFANATESYARESLRDVSAYQGRTYGAGVGFGIGRGWALDGNFELQRRNRTDIGYSVYTLGLKKEW